MLVRTALVAITCAACVDAPRVVDIEARTVPDATDAIAALHLRVASRDVVRCQAFAEWPVALPADRAADGDRLTVTAVDGSGAVLAVGDTSVDGDDLTVALTAVERPLPRSIEPNRELAAGGGEAGRQLAMTDDGTAAVVWIEPNHESTLLGRVVNGPPGALDHGLVDSADRTRDQPVIAASGEGFVTAWSLGDAAIRVHGLGADLAPLAPYGDLPLTEAAEGRQTVAPTLIAADGRVLALWYDRVRATRAGRVGLRWVTADGTPDGEPSYLGDEAALQHSATAAPLASGAVVLGWLEDATETSTETRLRLTRMPAGAGPDLGSAITVEAAGFKVDTFALAGLGDRLAVAWSTDGGTLHLALFDAALGQVGPALALAYQHQVVQAALVAQGDGFLLAWVERSPAGVHTGWLRWLGPDGAPRGPARPASIIPGGDQRHLSVAASPAGQAFVAWEQKPAPNRDGGILGRPIALDDTAAGPAPCTAPGAP